MPFAIRAALGPATLSLSLAACADEITQPLAPLAGTMTIEAVADYGFASLHDGAPVTSVSDPSASSEWDLAFFSTTVTLNGGEAGPAGVVGHCICQNAATTNDDVLAMTAESELADYEAVGAEDIPSSGGAWEIDVLTPAIAGWVTGTGEQASLVQGKFWKLRLDDGASFAKFRVASMAGATATTPGTVTIEYAVQANADASFGAVRTLHFDVVPGGGPVSVDLDANAIVASSTWDLRFDGYAIRVNNGVSGAGQAGAASPASGETFEGLTTAVTDASAYRADRYAGVFGREPWYRYNLTGQHRIHPTYDVYLVKRGNDVFKVQLLDYYGPAGEPRHITFRYEQIAG